MHHLPRIDQCSGRGRWLGEYPDRQQGLDAEPHQQHPEEEIEIQTKTSRIEGMHCAGCASRVKSLLAKQPGVRAAEVSYPSGEALVHYNEHTVTADRLREIVERAGYSADDLV